MEWRREPFKSNVKTNTKVSVSTLIFVFSCVCVCVRHRTETTPSAGGLACRSFLMTVKASTPLMLGWIRTISCSTAPSARRIPGNPSSSNLSIPFQREISASSSLKGWKFTIWWLIRLKISNPTLSIPKIFGRRYSDISLVIQMNPRRYAMYFSMATRDQSVITMCQTDDVFRPNPFQWIILKLWNEKRGAGQVLSIDQSTSLKS